jgi:hypothetical protein
LIGNNCYYEDHTKVFTFGIGSGCDTKLIENCAKAGNGKSFFVADYQTQKLKG